MSTTKAKVEMAKEAAALEEIKKHNPELLGDPKMQEGLKAVVVRMEAHLIGCPQLVDDVEFKKGFEAVRSAIQGTEKAAVEKATEEMVGQVEQGVPPAEAAETLKDRALAVCGRTKEGAAKAARWIYDKILTRGARCICTLVGGTAWTAFKIVVDGVDAALQLVVETAALAIDLIWSIVDRVRGLTPALPGRGPAMRWIEEQKELAAKYERHVQAANEYVD